MNETEARQHALGYAAGREDASSTRTVRPDGEPYTGFLEFAHAYAGGWADYNAERRSHMVNCKVAYDTWQASRGQTIFADELPADPATPTTERPAR
jgi:hypothetical protein